MRCGAEPARSHSVDSSAKAVELTNANVALNFPPEDHRHEAFCEDAFKYLDSHDDKYDLIILDPPAFAKHRGALRNALKGYTRLNVKGFQRIRKGGILFTFSCSQVVSKGAFPSGGVHGGSSGQDARCASSTSCTSPPTTPSTSTIPRANISRASSSTWSKDWSL